MLDAKKRIRTAWMTSIGINWWCDAADGFRELIRNNLCVDQLKYSHTARHGQSTSPRWADHTMNVLAIWPFDRSRCFGTAEFHYVCSISKKSLCKYCVVDVLADSRVKFVCSCAFKWPEPANQCANSCVQHDWVLLNLLYSFFFFSLFMYLLNNIMFWRVWATLSYTHTME